MFNINKESGFIKWIVIIIIAIIVLSYFNFDLRAIIESPMTQGNIGYVWGGIVFVWDTYLANPISYLWNDIFINLFWDSFTDNMQRIKEGRPTTIDELTPTANPIN